MKKLILILAILIPSLSWGQFDLSVNGGYLASVPIGYDKDAIVGAKTDYNPIFGIKATYSLSNFDLGIRADIYSVGFKSEISLTDNNAQPIFSGYAHIKSAYYGISPNIFVDYKINDFRIGVNVGILSSNKFRQHMPNYKKGDVTSSYKSTYFSFGVQASYRIPISEKFSIIPEISPRLLINTKKQNGGINDYFIIPIMVGIDYQF